MKRVLITAFEPFDMWTSNSSWLALVELTRDLPTDPKITTRLYPVDFARMQERLIADLANDYDVAIHLGQSSAAAGIHLEMIGLNVRGELDRPSDEAAPLVPDAPTAYRSTLPLARWASEIRELGIPARVSHHAGTYLCNAALFLSLHHTAVARRQTQVAFVHVPLDPTQVASLPREYPTLPAAQSAHALRTILQDLRGESVSP